MNSTSIIRLVYLVLLAFFLSCTVTNKTTFNEEVEKKKISKTIDSCIAWAKEKNIDLLFRVVANDSNYLSVHPSNRVVRGFNQFKQNVPFWMNPDFKYVRHELKDLTISLSASGEVAWFYCILDDLNTW